MALTGHRRGCGLSVIEAVSHCCFTPEEFTLIFVPNPEEDVSLTLFSPPPRCDSFTRPFINILALVVQKNGASQVSVPIQQF